MTQLKFLRPGMLTTIQDAGRIGLAHQGITQGGFLDCDLANLANLIIGNKKDTEAFEFMFVGPELMLIGESVDICVTGDFDFYINDIKAKTCKIHKLYDGDRLSIGQGSVVGYLAVKGGLDVDIYAESKSMHTMSKIGPNRGQPLRKNTIINAGKQKTDHFIRVLPGPHYNLFSDPDVFFQSQHFATYNRDRRAMFLRSKNKTEYPLQDIVSEGNISGSIQILPDGNCLVLLKDYGATGGYPKLGIVIDEDLHSLIQTPAGKALQFKLISREQL